jgi:replicative DNA helicase
MLLRGHKGGRNYELAEISATLRALNLELKIPIMVMAQVLKDVWNKPERRAGIFDIKDCSEFAFDATIVELPYRPEYVKIENDPDGNPYPKGYADIHRGKGRESGPGGWVCQFDWIRGFHDLPVVDEFERYNPMAGITRPAFDDQDIPF